MHCSCLIKGGLVCDGTGSEPAVKDVVTLSDRIVAVGENLHGLEPVETIDASGMVVSPGFIDVHSHDDFSVFMTPDMEYKIRQGVTTSIVGNCGFSISPYKESIEYTIFYHDKAKMPVWDNFSSYMECFDRQPASINIGILAGLGAFRYAVKKDSREPLGKVEVSKVRLLLEQSVRERVLGLSLGLAYFPGIYSSTGELIEIVDKLRDSNLLFAIHMRDEGHNLIPALEEALEISRNTGVPIQISHFKALGKDNAHLFGRALEMVDRAILDGLSVTVDFYPFDSGCTALKEVLRWNVFSPNPQEAMFSADASEIVIITPGKHPEWVGKSIADLAAGFGLPPEETAKRICGVDENVLVAMRDCITEENIEAVMKKPYSMIGSDGIPTETGFSNPRLYGTFPRVLGRYSRDRKVITLAEAVRKMTGFPASRFNLADRGIIREGAFADIVIFDCHEILDKADYSNPKQYPVGLRDVFVNGEMVLKGGALTGKRAGRTLKSR